MLNTPKCSSLGSFPGHSVVRLAFKTPSSWTAVRADQRLKGKVYTHTPPSLQENSHDRVWKFINDRVKIICQYRKSLFPQLQLLKTIFIMATFTTHLFQKQIYSTLVNYMLPMKIFNLDFALFSIVLQHCVLITIIQIKLDSSCPH